MNAFSDMLGGGAWLYPLAWGLLVYFVKASAVSAVALGVLASLRNSSALVRYLIAKISLVTVVVMPVVTSFLPRWDFGVTERLTSILPGQVVLLVSPVTPSSAPAETESTLTFWLAIGAGLWLVGVLFNVVRMMVGQRAVTRIVREAQSFRDSTERLSLTASAGIPESVPVVVGATAVPFAVGARHGVIVLPEDAWRWSERRVRMVLLHEYFHVKRFDTLWIGLGNITRAVHWFNPIVRLLYGRFLNECERACDDAVLADGTSPESYAQCLIDVLRAAARPRWAIAVGATMARTTNMEGRLMSILNDRQRATRLSHRMRFLVAVLAAVLLLPIAAWQVQAGDTTKVAAKEKAKQEEAKKKLKEIQAGDATNVTSQEKAKQEEAKNKQLKEMQLKEKEKQFQEQEQLPGENEFVAVEVFPEMLKMVPPEYPRLAKKAGIQGTVWVKALVDKEGNSREVLIAKSSGNESLDNAALMCAKTARFKPGIANGKPVATWVTYNIDFKLEDDGKQ
ncbi:TonB family protein [bacterium]|nr:TonB family protein [bacterium]